jgi:hypothetical protein
MEDGAMVDKSPEYRIEEEMQDVLPDLEQRMANHDYGVYALADAISLEEDTPYPPELWGEYGANIPQVYIADEDATAEDILHDGDFVGGINVIHTEFALRDPVIEDDVIDWAEDEWEPNMRVDTMDDPTTGDPVDRSTVVYHPSDALDDPM